jgi:acyl transferase domain-containing protein
MANTLVLDTLRTHRQEIGEEQQLARVLVAQYQEDLAQRQASLKTTTEQGECAVDEADIARRHQALREAEARLAVAEQHCTLLQKSLRDLTADIDRVRQGA